MTPYYSDDLVTLYHGDMREVLPALGITADCVIADPPYEATSLAWDRWPGGWLESAAAVSRSMWCFLPLRQFAEPPYRGIEFRAAGWQLSQDMAWEKHMGSGFAADRFRRVHETMTHWYQGRWGSIRHEVPRIPWEGKPEHSGANRKMAGHMGAIRSVQWTEDGTRLARSVLKVRSMHMRAIHKCEKPVPLLTPLIAYACPPGGLVIDPFAGSGSTLEAARATGRRAVGIEADERHCEQAALRLSRPVQPDLFGGAA